MPRIHLILCLALLAAPTVRAQQPDLPKSVGTIPGEEQRTRDDLNSAAKLVDSQRYDEAIRRYQQILAESGDLLVPVDANRSLPARWIVHQRLAVLPPEARKLYRDKVDDSARKWLEQGIGQRDEKLLDQVVSEAFCSRPAEQALQLLGDLALERGEFEAAQRWWRMIAPLASKFKNLPKKPASFELLFPDPKDKGALAQAKQILALALQGTKEPALAELKAFRELHPSAEGFLAGRKGKYVDILQSLVDSNERWNPAAAPGGSTWLTFSGDASRNYRLANANTPYWPDRPMWETDLPDDSKAKPHREADPPPGIGPSSRALAFHPVIIPGFVLVADALRVTAYHLATGKQAAQYDHRRDADNRNAVPESIDLRVPSHTDARYTLTVAGNRVYVRLGATRMKEPEDNTKPVESDNWLVCLGLERDGDSLKLQYRWQIRARLLDTDPVALFEGTPVVQDGRLLVARTRFDGRQVITSIDCYDADAPNGRKEPPPLRWTRDVWIMESSKAGEAVRHRADLLTMAGPFVVYCTHSGLIIALDAASGKRMWAYRYATTTSKPFDGILPRDLCPCIYAGGRIYAAPADADRIFCLDATTGENIWESSPANVVHLLGISRGKLFATLGGYPQGIRAYDANTGDPIWTKPDDGDRAPHGRGFLSDDFVFWPTRRGLKVLRQVDGEPQDAGSSSEPFGNIAFGEGCMIVATEKELWGFIPERLRLNFRQREVQERPEDALAHYKLGLALADAGKDDEAKVCFLQATSEAQDEDYHHGWPLRELAQRRLAQRSQIDFERKTADQKSHLIIDKDNATALPDFMLGGTGRPFLHHAEGPNLSIGLLIAPPFKYEKAMDIKAFEFWPLLPLEEPRKLEFPFGLLAIIGRHRDVICQSCYSRSALWSTTLHHPSQCFVKFGDSLIVASPGGLARLHCSNGVKLWEVSSADPTLAPAKATTPVFRTLSEPPLPKPFSAFRLAGTRLFMLHGRQKLLALDVEAGRFLWQRWAPGAPICDPEEGAAFTENYIATDDVILLQTTAGRYMGVDAVTGKVLYQQKQNSAVWPAPPVLLDNQRAVFAIDGEHIACIELASGKILWQKQIEGWSSLAGSAPQLRRDGSHLLLLVERNFGYELERWELETGKRDWSPIFLGRERINLTDVGITAEGYVLANGKSARAFSRDDGKLLWEMPLPDSSGRAWRVQAIRGAVLVYPDEALPEAAGSFPYPWPAVYHVFMRRTFPLFVTDSKSGKVLQEFKAPVQGPRATLLFGQTQAAIAVEGSIWRLKEAK